METFDSYPGDFTGEYGVSLKSEAHSTTLAARPDAFRLVAALRRCDGPVDDFLCPLERAPMRPRPRPRPRPLLLLLPLLLELLLSASSPFAELLLLLLLATVARSCFTSIQVSTYVKAKQRQHDVVSLRPQHMDEE